MTKSLRTTLMGFGAGLALAFNIGAVQAADMPEAAPTGYDWSGLYAGLHAGIGFGNVNSGDAPVPLFPSSYNIDGFLGGGLIGYNLQWDQLVFGIEGDVSFGDVDGNTTTGLSTPALDINFMATIRARAGFAWDNALLFLTAGVAFADVDYSDVGQLAPTSDSKTHTGFIFGGGIDWAFGSNLIGRLEYQYTDLGKKNYTVAILPDSVDVELSIVRAALMWKF